MAEHMTAVTAEQLRKQLVEIEMYARTRCLADDAGNKPDPNSALVHIANTLSQLAARLSGMAAVQWQPIETAPLDRRVELWIPAPANAAGITGYPTHGKWDRDQYSRRPRPFWHYDLVHRITDMRDNPPTHWRPESEPPHV